MESCLLNYYVLNDDLRNACDFNPMLLNDGKGIYEVFRVIDAIPLFLDEHIERFYHSANLLGTELSYSRNTLRFKLQKLIEANKIKTGNIRFQHMNHSEAGPLFLAWITPAIYPTDNDYRNGVAILSLAAYRKNPHAKRTNLPVRALAEDIIREKDVAEVLLINLDGIITECHRSNIFFVQHDTLVTPSAELVLPGITREKVIRLAEDNKIPFMEKKIHFSELETFDACFISSTSKNVLPVSKLDHLRFNPANEITDELAVFYNNYVKEHLKNFKW